jgi:hypothetical protein
MMDLINPKHVTDASERECKLFRLMTCLFILCLRMSISKFAKLKELLPTDNQKKNKRWKRMITTEERLVLILR